MFGAPKPRCRRGRSIRTLGALLKVLHAEPSVWHAAIGKPVPMAVVISWQLQYVLREVRAGQFYRVIRPNPQPGF